MYTTSDGISKRLEDAGFVDIKVYAFKQPYGSWAKNKKEKRLGGEILLIAGPSLESYGLALFTRVLGIDAEEATRLCQETWKEIINKKHHVYNNL
jgi:hypothetical protein